MASTAVPDPVQRPPRHRLRRGLRALSTILIVSGLMLILDAALTLVWQEPISAVYARLQQRQLAGKLDNRLANLTQLQLRALDRLRTERRRVAFLARVLRREVKPGDAIGRIKIKRSGTNFVVVEGTDPGDLRKGPGHYSDTSIPGLPGTVAIAGHRTTYLAPFRRLNQLRAGDLITIDMPYARFVYRFSSKHIVSPKAYRYVTRRRRFDQLALTACHPLYSAAQRIVVFARLADVQARGRARVAPSL
ncbi:MAG: sortase [Solirubrobacteraceae bacterium]|jgi:sortase A|nr:sortase [Solirubrobacteraceae bacterium]